MKARGANYDRIRDRGSAAADVVDEGRALVSREHRDAVRQQIHSSNRIVVRQATAFSGDETDGARSR